MTEIPKICFNCEHWNMDPGAINRKQRMIIGLASQMRSIPVTYGKCKATVINEKGVPESYDFGTPSSYKCDVFDRDGYELFSPVPED
jgi:hypothetical protein